MTQPKTVTVPVDRRAQLAEQICGALDAANERAHSRLADILGDGWPRKDIKKKLEIEAALYALQQDIANACGSRSPENEPQPDLSRTGAAVTVPVEVIHAASALWDAVDEASIAHRVQEEHDRLDKAFSLLEAAPPQPDPAELVEALEGAQATFHRYADNHTAKKTTEGDVKAKANMREAEKIDQALATYRGTGE